MDELVNPAQELCSTQTCYRYGLFFLKLNVFPLVYIYKANQQYGFFNGRSLFNYKS
jgi:hypothetical protein